MSDSGTEPGGEKRSVAVDGSLAVFADGFAAMLLERGYRPRSVRVQLRLLADFSCWLAGEGRDLAELVGREVEGGLHWIYLGS